MNQIRKHSNVLCINRKDAGFWLLLVFLTLPYMKPAYLARIPAVDLIFDILRGTSFLAIVFWYIIKRRPISSVIILVAVWRVFLVYSTIVHGGETYACIVASFSILSVMLLYDFALERKRIFVSSQLFCFELMIYVNLVTELLFPDGMYYGVGAFISHRNWFLGYYNNHTQFFIPALMFAWLYRAYTGKNLRTLLLTAAIFISSVLVWSGGVLLALSSMVIVYLFFRNRTRIFNYYSYWGIHIAFLPFILSLNVKELFIWLLDGILGKWSSLLSRIELWKKTIELISENPVFGYGVFDSSMRAAEYHVGWGATHAHNMILEILYECGIVGLSLWVIIVILSGKRVYKYRDSRESKIISIAFLAWCIVTLVEPFTTPFLMGMFVVACHCESESDIGKKLPDFCFG